MNERIKLDVCGQIYAVPRELIENGPSSRLSTLYKRKCSFSKPECIVIDRPPESFAAILAFYQTGELHIPMTTCPGAFIGELEYWEISPEVMSECCYNRMRSFLDDQDTLRTFKENARQAKSSMSTYNFLSECRAKIWETVEYTKPSLVGKIYFTLTSFMVLLSICVMAFSTDPSFKGTLTHCERLDDVTYSGTDGMCSYQFTAKKTESDHLLDQVDTENRIGENGHLEKPNSIPNLNKTIDEPPTNETFTNETTGYISMNRTELGNLTREHNPIIPQLEKPPPVIHIQELLNDAENNKTANFKVKVYFIVVLECLTNIYFTIDIILRLSACPFIKEYFLSVINCADAISLVGAYSYFLLYYTFPHLRYGSWIDNLSYIQMLRSFRFFRVVLQVRAGRVLVYSAREHIKDLSIVILFLISGMCTFASCLYIAEDSTTVDSIPDAWYWAIITMTTVGYGDIQPQTKIGKLISCVCAVSGVVLLALTVPIFTNRFLILYQHAESENVVMKFQKRRIKSVQTDRRKN